MSNKLKRTVNKIQYILNFTVEEVAKSIGYSRVHLTKQMGKKDDDDNTNALNNLLIEKHKGILQNVSKETLAKEDQADYINVENTSAGKEIGRLKEKEIYHSAAIAVLEQMVDKLVSDHTGTSIALVSGERKQATEMEAKRLFDEERKKHKQSKI